MMAADTTMKGRKDEAMTYSLGEIIRCPRCGWDYTHQRTVQVWQRNAEDADDGVHVHAQPKCPPVVSKAMAWNPSSRRDGMSVDLECEACEAVSTLCIIQRKGQTFAKWRLG